MQILLNKFWIYITVALGLSILGYIFYLKSSYNSLESKHKDFVNVTYTETIKALEKHIIQIQKSKEIETNITNESIKELQKISVDIPKEADDISNTLDIKEGKDIRFNI
jgi:CxxC motif-containing protein